MIGKLIIFVIGFVSGTLFGTAVGRWILEQLINFVETIVGLT